MGVRRRSAWGSLAITCLLVACTRTPLPSTGLRLERPSLHHVIVDTAAFVRADAGFLADQLLRSDSEQHSSAELALHELRGYRSDSLVWDRHLRDAWGSPLRVMFQVDSLIVSSAGEDREFGSADDIFVREGRHVRVPR